MASPPWYVFLGLLLTLMVVGQLAANYLLIMANLYPPDFQVIPVEKHSQVMEELQQERLKIERLGFEEFDRYYLNYGSYQVISFFFHSNEAPIYCHLVQIVKRIRYAIFYSEFPDGSKLLTVGVPNAGHLPQPGNYYLQVLERAPYDRLLEAHQDALEVLEEHGHAPRELAIATFRDYYRQQSCESFEYITKIPFWPAKITFWVLFKAGKKYYVPLREQVATGTVQIH